MSASATLAFLGRLAKGARGLGFGRGLDALRDRADRVLERLETPPLAAEIDGLRLRGYLRHRSFLESLIRQPYERLLRRLFLRHLEPGRTVVDGGAHLGLYSALAWSALGDKARILAFEPDPINFSALRFNMARNGCRGVELYPMALADARREAVFFQSPGTISGSLIHRPKIPKLRAIQVRCAALQDVLGNSPPERLLLKLDLEGGEPAAIEGMRELLLGARSAAMFVEVNPGALRDAGSGPGALVGRLLALGFGVQYIDEREGSLLPLLAPGDIQERKGNLFCLKGEAPR